MSIDKKNINLALYGQHHEYLKEISWRNRLTVTEYINKLIAEDWDRTGLKLQEPEKGIAKGE